MVAVSAVGDSLSKFMHDEDCKFGLRVTNVRKNKWIAYGDGLLLSKGNEMNLKLTKEALQTSVLQVHEAYRSPLKNIDVNKVLNIIPVVDTREENNTPLFQMKKDKLVRRKKIEDLQDDNVEEDWWGTSTALLHLLKDTDKKNSALPEAK